MVYSRRSSLRGVYYSDGGLAREAGPPVADKATQSLAQHGRPLIVSAGDDIRKAQTADQHGEVLRPPIKKAYSLNSFRPQVTLAIYFLQFVATVVGFIKKLFIGIYARLFTRSHLAHAAASLAPRRCEPSDWQCINAFANRFHSRPHLPTERTIAAQILWNYMKVNQALVESDVILLLGNYDTRTSHHACQLWHHGWAEYIMYTCIADTKKGREEQALAFERTAEAMQVPMEYVLLETHSSDITVAIPNSYQMLDSLGLSLNSLIVIHLPFMERLVQLTFQHLWPDTRTNITVTSSLTTMITFPNTTVGSMEQIVEDIAEAVAFILQFDDSSKISMPEEVVHAFRTLRPDMADDLVANKPDGRLSNYFRQPLGTTSSQRTSSISTYNGPVTRSATNSLPNKPIRFAHAKTIRLKFSKAMNR